MIRSLLLSLYTKTQTALAQTTLMLSAKKAQVDALEEELRMVNAACMFLSLYRVFYLLMELSSSGVHHIVIRVFNN